MNITELKEPFEIYHTNLGRFFPKTPSVRMLELIWSCGKHPVSNKEVRELMAINRPSATKLLQKLLRAGIVQAIESQPENGEVELTVHGRSVLADLEVAIGVPTTTHVQEGSPCPIRLGELEAGTGAVISKLRAKPAGQSEEPNSEQTPKRPPTGVARRRRSEVSGQISLDQLFAAAAEGN